MKKNLALALSIGTLLASPLMADARVVEIPRDVALNGDRALSVWNEGGGLILDFSALDERIQEIILDDMSRIGVSHCVLRQACGENPSPFIKLRQIKQIDFPHLNKTQVTLFTVNTVDRSGKWNSYQFPLSLGDGVAQYNKATIGAVAPTPVFAETPRIAKPPSPRSAGQRYSTIIPVPKVETVATVSNDEQIELLRDIKALLEKQPSNELPMIESDEPPREFTPVEIKPVVAVRSVTPKPSKAVTNFDQANALSRGMTIDPVNPRHWEWKHLNSAIRALRTGKTLEQASSVSGRPVSRLQQLMESGGL